MNVEDDEFTPIERIFYDHARTYIKDLVPQVWIDRKYRVDFYAPAKKMIIELDGHDYHSSPAQREHDARRDRYLSLQGFQIIRFTGREITRRVHQCVAEVLARMETLPDQPYADLAERGVHDSNPDTYTNATYYCTYMQKVLNTIFQKHSLKNRNGAYVKLRREGYDHLSVGVLENNQVYVAYSFNFNGDRAVDPELIFYRYFDTVTNRFELVPFSYEHYLTGYMPLAGLDDLKRIEIYDRNAFLDIANYAEGMARRIEFHGFLDDAEIDNISQGDY